MSSFILYSIRFTTEMHAIGFGKLLCHRASVLGWDQLIYRTGLRALKQIMIGWWNFNP